MSTDHPADAIVTHRGPADLRTLDTPVDPAALVAALADGEAPMLVRHDGVSVVGVDPVEQVRGRAVWDALERARPGAGRRDAPPGTTLAGGWVALLAHDLAGTVERLPDPVSWPAGPPSAWAGRYETVAAIDDDGRCVVASVAGAEAADHLAARAASCRPAERLGQAATRPVGSSLPGGAYERAVGRALEYIRAGDCYQVNLTQRLEVPWEEPAHEFARRLWGAAGPTAHRAYLGLAEGTVVSASPELLVRRQGDRASTAPIKGTAPPGDWERLRASAKDRAEHVMIVDLMRNDLGRCAVPGGVRVSRLFERLTTPYVEHMVSEITADLRAGVSAADLLRAVFPGGSVTGCPKVRALEVIRELEPVNRGPAFGSVVTVSPDGRLEASVAIRTAWVARGRAWYWCGGAVVWDSDPAAEHDEAWAKAAPFLAATGAVRPA